MDGQYLVLPLFAVSALILIYLQPRRDHHKSHYPPGPTIDGMPTYDSWVHYRDWGKEYGPFVYIRSQNVLVINHLQVAADLLENRARIYSDRDSSIMMDLSGLTDLNIAVQVAFAPFVLLYLLTVKR
ncbi:hypothetical protein GYMLUDRAFT_954700 [Collybiopsis luxurians FD-317 M1]|nr:hypothetical protein GYMLUDRAFT_954700 [Collybiopsis luxurians FD-317 M1]